MTDILKQVNRLPALPGTVLQVTGMLSNGSVEINAIAGIVKRDEALTAAILRAVNSARYGRPGRTFDLKQGMVRLGRRNLLQLVLQQQVQGQMKDGGASWGLERGALWRGALGGAIAADEIATNHKIAEIDLCFLCALLRDIGKLAIDSVMGRAYMDRVQMFVQPDRTFVEAERAAFGFDHAELGAALAHKWNLPDRVVNVIRHHHEPPQDPSKQDEIIDVVHAADVICLWAGLAVGHDGMQYRIDDGVRTRLKLDRREAEREIAATWIRLRETEDAMNGMNAQELSA